MVSDFFEDIFFQRYGVKIINRLVKAKVTPFYGATTPAALVLVGRRYQEDRCVSPNNNQKLPVTAFNRGFFWGLSAIVLNVSTSFCMFNISDP